MNFTAIAAISLMLFSALPSQAGTPEMKTLDSGAILVTAISRASL
jgi:hypothetical protein